MAASNPKIDAYIESAKTFAQDILQYIRETVHEYCPDAEEEIKWYFPNFIYQGKTLCSVAAFKEHVSFGFWLENAMETMKTQVDQQGKQGMFALGKIKSIEDLPPKPQLKAMIAEAMSLTEMGVTRKRAASDPTELETPADFQEKLDQNQKAKQIFEEFPPGAKREYISWFLEAKSESTRNNRMEQAIQWISEGKKRNWKYERKK